MRRGVELSNIKNIALILENCGLVIVHVEIVWCREKRHHGGEARCSRLAVHPIA